MTSVFAPHPSASSPQLKECLPLIILLRNRLKYALTDEVTTICVQQFIKIDGKVWTDITYPASFMDAIRIDKTAENFHLIYDTKSYFVVHHITPEKAKYKLCKVRKSVVGTKGVPHLVIDSLFRLILRLEKGPISSSLTLGTCVWWLEVPTWEELVWSPTERHSDLWMCFMGKMPMPSNIFIIGEWM